MAEDSTLGDLVRLIDGLAESTQASFKRVEGRLERIENRLDRIDDKLDRHEKRIEALEARACRLLFWWQRSAHRRRGRGRTAGGSPYEREAEAGMPFARPGSGRGTG